MESEGQGRILLGCSSTKNPKKKIVLSETLRPYEKVLPK
jgi:hypothetical protein